MRLYRLPAFEQICIAAGGYGKRVEDPAALPDALGRATAVVTARKASGASQCDLQCRVSLSLSADLRAAKAPEAQGPASTRGRRKPRCQLGPSISMCLRPYLGAHCNHFTAPGDLLVPPVRCCRRPQERIAPSVHVRVARLMSIMRWHRGEGCRAHKETPVLRGFSNPRDPQDGALYVTGRAAASRERLVL
jgi:hypothetical protein